MSKGIVSNNFKNSVGSDINEVCIDISKAADKRVEDYIEQIHNPYCFKCDNTLVRVDFNPNGHNLENAMMNFFSRLHEI